MLTASFRPRKSDTSVSSETLDLPSMGDTNKAIFHRKDSSGTTASGTQLFVEQVLQEESGGGGGGDNSGGGRWREVTEYYKPTKTKSKRAILDQTDNDGDRPHSSSLEVGKRGENNSEGDENSLDSTGRSSPWLMFVATLLVVLAGAVACFITLGPNTAILQSGKASKGALDDTVQQQLIDQQQGRGQEMLDRAERVSVACGESSSLLRNNIGWLKTCRELCHTHMCCVEEDEEYSCVDDALMECAVYAGCVVLIDDNFW